MNTLRTSGTARRFSLAAALCGIALLLGAGCVFLDGHGAHGDIRGYTRCGNFLGGEECSPGQYCADPQWSECALGCLSDVNCASNQYCFKRPSQQVGVCENVRATVVVPLWSELEGSGTAALDGSGASVE